MYDEEVRPYDLLSLLMEVDGLYRALLYEKTLDNCCMRHSSDPSVTVTSGFAIICLFIAISAQVSQSPF